ncbi:hypothetical protein [Nocardia seriolae]|uniref:hypothetical protein n=1 Tax=Nocardia seriolae TaxID=37332 RepID=UPI0012BC3BCC|nr:hypothetical protein [Nocardia seriolae]MTK38559.1 hypothetical protein [Nocardia seriolae]
MLGLRRALETRWHIREVEGDAIADCERNERSVRLAHLHPENIRPEFGGDSLVRATYLLRSGESPGNADSSKVIEVRQAAVALACATGDVGHAVTAKREVSKLFDRDSGPYEALFNPSVEGIFLIRVTKVVSDVDEALDDAYSESEGQRIGIAVHGRRVIAHLILNNIGQKNLKNPDFDFDQALRDVQSSALRILDSFTENFPENAYPGNVFKNRKRCEELISNVK